MPDAAVSAGTTVTDVVDTTNDATTPAGNHSAPATDTVTEVIDTATGAAPSANDTTAAVADTVNQVVETATRHRRPATPRHR